MTLLKLNPTSSEPSLVLVEAVQNVFARLEAQLGTKVADLYASAPADAVHAEWAAALSGFTKREVNRGLSACQHRIFAPTLGEFTLLCRPTLDPEIAWIEAADGMRSRNAGELGDWSHPAVYRAAVTMVYELGHHSFGQCKKIWTWRLEKEFSKGWGEPVPPVALRIEQEKAKSSPPNAEQKAKIAELLNLRTKPVVPANHPLTEQEMAAAQARFEVAKSA